MSDKYGRKYAFSIANILYIVIRFVLIKDAKGQTLCEQLTCRIVTYQLQEHYKLFIGLIIVGNSFFPFGVRVGWVKS